MTSVPNSLARSDMQAPTTESRIRNATRVACFAEASLTVSGRFSCAGLRKDAQIHFCQQKARAETAITGDEAAQHRRRKEGFLRILRPTALQSKHPAQNVQIRLLRHGTRKGI